MEAYDTTVDLGNGDAYEQMYIGKQWLVAQGWSVTSGSGLGATKDEHACFIENEQHTAEPYNVFHADTEMEAVSMAVDYVRTLGIP
jgi:hypothetical protein